MARRAGGRSRGGYGGRGRSSSRSSGRSYGRGRMQTTFPRHTWTTRHGTKSGYRTVQHSKLKIRQGGGFSSTQFKRDEYNPGHVAGAPDTTPPPAQRTSVATESSSWLGKPLRGKWLGKGTQPVRTPGKR